MQLSRPDMLFLELRERAQTMLARSLSADSEFAPDQRWLALAPHLGIEVELENGDLAVFEALSTNVPVPYEALVQRFDQARIDRLVRSGLLIGDHAGHASLRAANRKLREEAWWPPAAVAHAFGRWSGVDVEEIERTEGRRTMSRLAETRGLPPTEAPTVRPPESRQALPSGRPSAFDELLVQRTTCRNFDPDAHLPLPELATLLHRVFGVQAAHEIVAGATMLKKNSPSGGGLHPIEAYLLVQRVEGIPPGLYHYQCSAHALESMRALPAQEAASLAHELVAGQAWFATAPVLLLMAARFERTYWKYPHHAKAWRVIQLDAGHLSQNLYLSATEQGLGAFITAAINDECAERLFELDGISTGAIAVCGFGKRAAETSNVEFDPLGKAVR